MLCPEELKAEIFAFISTICMLPLHFWVVVLKSAARLGC